MKKRFARVNSQMISVKTRVIKDYIILFKIKFRKDKVPNRQFQIVNPTLEKKKIAENVTLSESHGYL